MPFTLPPLPYDYNALEPIISAATLKVHHGAHHRGYIEKLNALVKGSDLEGAALEVIIKRSARDSATNPASRSIFNNASQAWNHGFFWNSLRSASGFRAPQGALAVLIDADFGSLPRFSEAFKSAATGLFGSGWVWLVEDEGALAIRTTSNADNPIVQNLRPLLVLDVWEHAYYLDHQSRRDLYAAGVVNHLLNWEFAERNFSNEEALHA